MKRQLLDYLGEHSAGGVALAYSGGVDSAVLLEALHRVKSMKEFSLAVFYFSTPLQDRKEEQMAREAARLSGEQLHVLRLDLFQAEPRLRNNPPDRCYLCKKLLFGAMARQARELGLETLMDGTNTDDLRSFRPGLRALREFGVLSPLAEVGMDKQAVRSLAEEWKLEVARKPSSPCLATRWKHGAELTEGALSRVAAGEEQLRKMFPGKGVRLRVHGDDLARVEVEREDVPEAARQAAEMVAILHTLGFRYVTLDLEGFRSGSMDEIER